MKRRRRRLSNNKINAIGRLTHKPKRQVEEAVSLLEKLRSFLNVTEPELVYLVVTLLNRQGRAITYKELREAILTGDIDSGLLEEWRQDYARFVAEKLLPRWMVAMKTAVAEMEAKYPEWYFDPMGDGVRAWTEQHSAEFVTSVTNSQIDGLRAVIQRASVLETLTVDQLARAIRPMVGLYRAQSIANLNYYTKLIESGMAEKKALDLSIRYAARQHRYRGYLIARQELAMAYNTGAHEGIKQAQAAGYMGEVVKVWSTADDERTCFPKNTKISTPNGECDIQDVKPGDYVNTPDGAMKVHKTINYKYDGDYTLIVACGRSVTATKNHPFKTQNGWKEAGSLTTDDIVYFTGNKSGKVEAVFNFSFSKSNNTPTILCNFLVASSVSVDDFGMPILPVSLNNDTVFRKAEVNAITSKLNLGLEIDTKLSKSGVNFNFKRRPSGGSPVTMQGAVPTSSLFGGNDSEIFPTSFALDDNRRSPALFGTEMPLNPTLNIAGLLNKDLATPLTRDILSIGKTTLTGADGVPISNSDTNLKDLSANGTHLGDHSGAFVGEVTFIGAEFARLVSGVEEFATMGTLDFFVDLTRLVVTFVGAETSTPLEPLRARELFAAMSTIIKKHSNHLGDIISEKYHEGKTTVYNLEVCTNHVYYANDFLVHNCPICGALEGAIVGMDEDFKIAKPQGYKFTNLHPPAHYMCRCAVMYKEINPPK